MICSLNTRRLNWIYNYFRSISGLMMKESFISLIITGSIIILSLSGCVSLPAEVKLSTEAKYDEAAKIYENRIKNFKEASVGDLNEVCVNYFKIKDYIKISECIEEMERRVEKYGKEDFLLFGENFGLKMRINLKNTAILYKESMYLDLGQYDKIISLFVDGDHLRKIGRVEESGNDIFWKNHPLITSSSLAQRSGFKALVYALNGNEDEANKHIKVFNDFIDKYRNISCSDIELLMAISFNAGPTGAKANVAMENYEDALSIINQMEECMKSSLAPKSVRELFYSPLLFFERNFIFAKSNLELGNFNEAKLWYDKLLTYPQLSVDGDINWIVLFDRGSISEIEGNITEAIEYYKKAIQIIESQRNTIQNEGGKIGFTGNKQGVYRKLINALFSEGQYAAAFEYVERSKARALVDLLASKKQFSGSKKGAPTRLNTLLAELEKAEMDSIKLDYRISSSQETKIRSIILAKKQHIANADPELSSLISVSPPDVTEIHKLLPPDETLVEYYGDGNPLFIFIINHHGVHGVKLNVKKLTQDIETFRKNIMLTPEEMRGLTVIKNALDTKRTSLGFNKVKMIGKSLYEKLIHPVEGMITTKNLTIVPHGALHYLPFYALYEKDGFLIDRYNIRVLPSASVMTFLKDHREGHAGNLLAFGNPDLGDSAYDLPGAQNEAIAITKDKPKSKLLLRKQATETAIKRFGDQFRYIHFATHGTFDAEKPLSSGLLLAGDSENDGTLTVGELYDLYLPADLVTLSACETALGKVANGDDVVGFTRGFLYAGVSSIVSSLWKVDDQATSILMQQFYKSLKETDKRSALRTAQLKVKDTYNSHPYFWAAFQITGSVQ